MGEKEHILEGLFENRRDNDFPLFEVGIETNTVHNLLLINLMRNRFFLYADQRKIDMAQPTKSLFIKQSYGKF